MSVLGALRVLPFFAHSIALVMSRRCVATILVLTCVLSALASAAFAQDEIHLLTGMVKGRAGDPKQFVGVQLQGPRRYVTMTNADGEFRVSRVVPGRYTVRVRQGDYVETFSLDVRTERLDLRVKW